MSRVQYTQSGRFGCVSSEARTCEIRRPKITFVNVLFPLSHDPQALHWAIRVDCKDKNYLSIIQQYSNIFIKKHALFPKSNAFHR